MEEIRRNKGLLVHEVIDRDHLATDFFHEKIAAHPVIEGDRELKTAAEAMAAAHDAFTAALLNRLLLKQPADQATPAPEWENRPAVTMRRIGRFRISRELLQLHSPELAAVVFSRVAVLRAEYLMQYEAIEYVALGADFEPITEGAEPPLYEFLLKKDDDGNATLASVQRL